MDFIQLLQSLQANCSLHTVQAHNQRRSFYHSSFFACCTPSDGERNHYHQLRQELQALSTAMLQASFEQYQAYLQGAVEVDIPHWNALRQQLRRALGLPSPVASPTPPQRTAWEE